MVSYLPVVPIPAPADNVADVVPTVSQVSDLPVNAPVASDPLVDPVPVLSDVPVSADVCVDAPIAGVPASPSSASVASASSVSKPRLLGSTAFDLFKQFFVVSRDSDEPYHRAECLLFSPHLLAVQSES